MVSQEQKREILEKLSAILSETKNCSSIKEISEKLNIPTSTIQRFLNREDYYEELAQMGLLKEENVKKAFAYSKEWLQKSKKQGLSAGGTTSQRKHGFTKGEDGKFNGHVR